MHYTLMLWIYLFDHQDIDAVMDTDIIHHQSCMTCPLMVRFNFFSSLVGIHNISTKLYSEHTLSRMFEFIFSGFQFSQI